MKKANKIKLREFTKISNRLKALAERLATSTKQMLSAKEINLIKSDMKVIYSSQLNYQLVEKSKVGKALNMFLKNSRFLKQSKTLKQMRVKVEMVKRKVSNFVKNYFFDENIPSDSEITSYHSENESVKRKPTRQKQFNPLVKADSGFNVLLKATQKIDELGISPHIAPVNPYLFNTPEREPSARKHSVNENSLFQQVPAPTPFKPSRTLLSPGQSSIGAGDGPSMLDQVLFNHQRQRSHSLDLPNLNQAVSEASIDASKTIEAFLVDYLLSLPANIAEFYKFMGELYVSQILTSREDISSPTELMKELLLGRRSEAGHELRGDTLITQMMSQASRDPELQNFRPETFTHAPQGSFLPEEAIRSLGAGYHVGNSTLQESKQQDQNPVQKERLVPNPESPEPKEPSPKETPGFGPKKRDLKAENKQVVDNSNISELDTQKETKEKQADVAPKSPPKSYKGKPYLKKNANSKKSEGTTRLKRAPKKASQRVFRPKISEAAKQMAPENKRSRTEEDVTEFCEGIVNDVLVKIL